MQNIRMDSNWHKVNTITLKCGNKTYDLYNHPSCVFGKRWGMSEWITLTEKDFKKYTSFTGKRNKNLKGRTIRITKCEANGHLFDNITPGSKHTVIPPPEGYTDDSFSVWVMGCGEPVKVLNNEFQDVKE